MLAFCVATSFVVAILYGLAPAWQATGMSLAHIMSLDTRTATGGSSTLRRALAIAEVAVAVLLLCGAGLLLRTLLTLEDVDPGHRAGELLTTIVGPGCRPNSRRDAAVLCGHRARSSQRARRARRRLGQRACRSTGIFSEQAFQIDGDPPRPPTDRDGTGYQIVSPSYFRLLGVPVLEGREFTDGDATNAPQVCIVDEAFVRRYLKGRTPIGTRVPVNAMVTAAAGCAPRDRRRGEARQGAARRSGGDAAALRADRAEHVVAGVVGGAARERAG